MTNSAPPPELPAPPRICENCGTALQGGYCHLCGQSEQSPLRHLGHAVEEVFESFWHLDGRIFRTLRRLWIPGRVANEYLAGHRVRYVAPVRLFVILTALTFFVAQFLVEPAGVPERTGGNVDISTTIGAFEAADSVAEVERIRDEALEELADVRRRMPAYLPGADAGIISAEGATRRSADARIEQLRADGNDDARPAPEAGQPPPPEAEAEAEPGPDGSPQAADIVDWGHPQSLDRMLRNTERISESPRELIRALLSAAPMTLFATVPLFAVMLKLAYLFKRRLYLEHVVIALYSHAWLMLVLLLYFLTVLAAGWLPPQAGWIATPLSWLQLLLVCAMPVYLLWMQKRVYRQGWPMTLLKYCVIGFAYLSLVMTVAIAMLVYVMFTL